MSARNLPKKVVALDWDLRALRIVHAFVSKRGVKVDRLLAAAIPPSVDVSDPMHMGQHIRRVLEQEEIGTKHAIVDIPRDQAILNTLRLPTRSPDELPGMVEIQIAKELPFAQSEAVIDFAAEGVASHEAMSDVLVAAIRREVLEQYEATIVAAGLRLHRIGLRPYAHKVAVCDRLKHAMPERLMFIDVRPTLTEIDIIVKSSLVFSRAASVTVPTETTDQPQLSLVGADPSRPSGTHDFSEKVAEVTGTTEDVIQALVVEVSRSIEAYRANDPGATIDHAVIGGDVGVEEALAEMIQSRLGIATELYNPASSFGWEPDEGAEASAFAATLGLVLGQLDASGLHFDFLNPKKAVSQAQERLKKAPLVAAVIVLFAAAGAVGVAQYTGPKRAELLRIDRAILELEANVKDNDKFLAIVDKVRSFETDQHIWVDVLYDVMSVLPSNRELVVDHIAMSDKEPQLVLKTRTKKPETAEKVIQDIEALRSEGSDRPPFRVSMGSQSEKAKQKYRYSQAIKVTILGSKRNKKSRGRS